MGVSLRNWPLFPYLVQVSRRDTFAPHRSRRGIPLSAAAPCLTNIMFLPGRIQQSVSVLKEKLVWPASFLWHPGQSRGLKKLPGQCEWVLFCADVTFKSQVASTVTECALVYVKTKAGLCQWKGPLCGPRPIRSALYCISRYVLSLFYLSRSQLSTHHIFLGKCFLLLHTLNVRFKFHSESLLFIDRFG